ncbi:LOW QUALITY PROTEIN: SNF2-like protein [Aggregatibacter actinomycetemcomitans ANH9381]|nr:LOW QUALITY PROTEIN: SNF2-like protein [Aggregatibacter actinomycetemcomitans ANH9381]
MKNPLQEGVLLADEVGLGKTIEAGLVLCQMWAERKRKLLIVCPAILRKQWANELAEKFNLPTLVVDKAVVMAEMRQKSGSKLLNFCKNHLEQQVMIVSHQYATKEMATFKQFDWDLVVIDEAHKMRNAYKTDNKMGKAMRQAFGGKRKLLLTATPLQNSLMELYGLSTLLDEHLFGDKKFFQKEFVRKGNLSELKSRMAKFIKRTLRKNVLEYVRYTEQKTITQEFMPSDAEQQLYEAISDFLHKETIYALPKQHKHLTALILRKLLASSPKAVLGTLRAILDRLLSLKNTGVLSSELAVVDELLADEGLSDADLEADEETPETEGTLNLNVLDKEIREIEGFIRLAESLVGDSKLNSLLKALQTGFGEIAKLGATQKAIIFTESVRTQHYLYDFLLQNGYADQVVMFSGTNNDAQSTQIYHDWLACNAGTEKVTGSVDVDSGAFDQAVLDRLKVMARERLSAMEQWFWGVTQFALAEKAVFNHSDWYFLLKDSPVGGVSIGRYLLPKKTRSQQIEGLEYRLNQPLGQYCVNEALNTQTPNATLVFDYTHYPEKISLLEQYKGQSGWLKLDKICVTSPVEKQDVLVFSVCDQQGNAISDEEFTQKLFSLPAQVRTLAENQPLGFDALIYQQIEQAKQQIQLENNVLLKTEMLRIQTWAEDQMQAAEDLISEIKEDIRAKEREAVTENDLARQIDLQESVSKLRKQLRKARNEIDDVQDEIQEEESRLLKALKAKVQQTMDNQSVFLIQWKIL